MIKTLVKSVRQYKKDSILSSLFMVLEVVMEVLIPFFMASLIDNGIDAGDMGYVTRMGFLLIFAALLSLSFGTASGTFAASASTGFAANLRVDIYRSIQGFSFANIDKFSPASLVSRLTTDITNLQQAYQAIIRHAVRALCMVSFALFMAFRINSKMALIFVAVAPVLGIGLIFIITKAHPFFVRAFKTYDKINTIVQENLQGIRVVKSYARESHEISKFEAVSSEIAGLFVSAQKRVSFNMPLMQLCTYTCMILISWLGAHLIVTSDMTTGDLMSMFAYVMQILMSLMMVSMVFIQIIIARTSAERVTEVLTELPDIANRTNAEPIKEVRDGSITFESVGFSYGNQKDRLCLTNIDLHIRSGETIGILGGTGSSKTTLVQLIPRLYDVTVGRVSVGGVDVRDYDLETLRGSVAMVLQNNILFSGSVRENLQWGNPNASIDELIKACQLAQADGFVNSFTDGYDTHIEEGGANLSGGQRQRLCIARALLKNPKVLILDDSTSAVDMATEASIRQSFREVIPGTTKLIIAQRIASVQDADRIIVLDNGMISAFGTHDELLQTNTIYQEVYRSQVQSGGDFDAH